MKLSTRKIAVAGLLGAISIVLAVSGLGMIPVPSLTGRATIMHIPVIIASLIEGPIVGALTGLIFGLYSFFTPTGAIPADPIVRILPRILIGITTYYTYRSLIKFPNTSVIVASIVGALTNTVGFVGLAIWLGYLPKEVVVTIFPQALAELILGTILVYLIMKAIRRR